MQRNPLTNNGNAKVTTVFNLKLEALSDATLISGVDFDAFVHDLSGLDNEQKINYITEKKAPYLFSSSQLEQVLKLTPSVKTCMVIMAELGPRLIDPKANVESFVAKFRYVEEKQKVEEILKARAQVISLASFNSSKSSSSSMSTMGRGSAGRGRGRGGNSGRGSVPVVRGGRGGRGQSCARNTASIESTDSTTQQPNADVPLDERLAVPDCSVGTDGAGADIAPVESDV